MFVRMARLIVFATVLVSAQACGKHEPGIGGTKARELITKGALLVDVRSSLEFRFWTPIEGAVNISAGDLEDKLKDLDKTRPIIVYSRTGVRSGEAAAMLSKAGFEVYNLGGLADWDR